MFSPDPNSDRIGKLHNATMYQTLPQKAKQVIKHVKSWWIIISERFNLIRLINSGEVTENSSVGGSIVRGAGQSV